jgi:hypothetical protein
MFDSDGVSKSDRLNVLVPVVLNVDVVMEGYAAILFQRFAHQTACCLQRVVTCGIQVREVSSLIVRAVQVVRYLEIESGHKQGFSARLTVPR